MEATDDLKYEFVMQGSFYAHRALKRDTEMLNALAGRINKFSKQELTHLKKWYQFYWNMMEQHHQAEDDIMFVAIEKRLERPSEIIEGMETEHTRLQFLIDEIKRLLGEAEREPSLAEKLKPELSANTNELLALFNSHISKEEKYVYDNMRRYFTPHEQKQIEDRVKRKAPFNYLSYMIPWMRESLSEEEKITLEEMMPWYAKLLNQIFWKKKYLQIVQPVRAM